MPRSSMHSTVMSNATSDRVCPPPDRFIETPRGRRGTWGPLGCDAHETACGWGRDAKRQNMTRSGPDRNHMRSACELDGNPRFARPVDSGANRYVLSHDVGGEAHRARGAGLDPAAAG